MFRKTTIITFTITVLILSSCYTLQVNKLDCKTITQNEKSLKENGIIYSLPKKEFQLEITVEQTISVPSPLIKVDTHFRMAIKPIEWQLDLIRNDTITYKITDVKLLERSIPDSEHVYFVSLLGDRALFFKASHSFSFSSGIFLTQSKNVTEDQTGEFIAEAIPFLLKTATNGLLPGLGLGNSFIPKGLSIEEFALEIVKDNKSQKVKPEKAVPRSITEQVVDRILILQEERRVILSGFAPEVVYKREHTTLLLKEIDKEIATLIMFIEGKKTIKTTKTVYSFDPSQLPNPLVYFSKEKGLSLTDNTLKPISITIPPNQVETCITAFFDRKNEINKRKGIYYRIPYTTELVVRWDGKDLLRTPIVIPQLGSVGFLPSKIAVRSNDIRYTLDEKTGALITFEANGEGLSLESTQKVLDAVSKLPEDQIKRLENEIKLKELQEQLDSLNRNQR
jgi:Domain of unknown function (DUF4831)